MPPMPGPEPLCWNPAGVPGVGAGMPGIGAGLCARGIIGRPGTNTLEPAGGLACGPGRSGPAVGPAGRCTPGGRIGRTGPVGDSFLLGGFDGSGAPGMVGGAGFAVGIAGGVRGVGGACTAMPMGLGGPADAACVPGIAGGAALVDAGIGGTGALGGRAGLLGWPGTALAFGRLGSGPSIAGTGGGSGFASPSSARSTNAVASTGLDFGAGTSGAGSATGGVTGGIGGLAPAGAGPPSLGWMGGRRATPTPGLTPTPKGGRNIVAPPPPILIVGRIAAVELRCVDPGADWSTIARRLRRRGSSSSGSGSACCALAARLRMRSRIRPASSASSELEWDLLPS